MEDIHERTGTLQRGTAYSDDVGGVRRQRPVPQRRAVLQRCSGRRLHLVRGLTVGPGCSKKPSSDGGKHLIDLLLVGRSASLLSNSCRHAPATLQRQVKCPHEKDTSGAQASMKRRIGEEEHTSRAAPEWTAWTAAAGTRRAKLSCCACTAPRGRPPPATALPSRSASGLRCQRCALTWP